MFIIFDKLLFTVLAVALTARLPTVIPLRRGAVKRVYYGNALGNLFERVPLRRVGGPRHRSVLVYDFCNVVHTLYLHI